RWLPGTRILTDASRSRWPGAELTACERAKVRARVVEPRVRPFLSRLPAPPVSARGDGAQAQLLEPRAQLLAAAAHAGGQHPKVGTEDREHATVEVLALALQRRGEAIEDVRLGIVELVQPDQVDRELGVAVEAACGRLDEADHLAVEIARQQLIG